MEDAIEVRARDLLTLVVILAQFEKFNDDIIDLLKNSKDYSFNKIQKLKNNGNVIGSKKLKEFYSNNKDIINVVNGYSNIGYFIDCNYDVNKGEIKDDFRRLYNYLLDNNGKLKSIADLVLRIERLGFEKILFNDQIDFTSSTYYTSSSFNLYDEFSYLDNMYVIPTYDGQTIEYKTRDSSYEIIIEKGINNEVYGKKIIFNDLLMNAEQLPLELTKEETFDKIVKLRSDVQSQYDILRESINLSIGIDSLKSKYCWIYNLANICDVIDIKTKLLSVLNDLKEDILEMEYLSDSYENLITNNNKVLTKEKVRNEKMLELRRRKEVGIDYH